jgi:allophanate hydrolase subunit 2
VILLNDVVQVLALPKLDVHTAVGDQASHGGYIGAALVDSDLLWHVVQVVAHSKNRRVAATSRRAVMRKSTVWPSLSTARYKYFHWLATST